MHRQAYTQRSQTRVPSRKQETTPSSLTFRTGPKRLATRAAVVRAPSARRRGARSGPERVGVVAEDRAEGEQAAGAVGRPGRRRGRPGPRGRRGRGRSRRGRGPGSGGPAWPAGRRGSARRAARRGPRRASRSCGAISRPTAAPGSSTTTNRPPWRSSARSRAVWKRTRASARVGHRACPDGELRRRVEHPPAAVGEGERLDAAGEELDLLVRAQDQADVAAGAGRPRVARRRAQGTRRAARDRRRLGRRSPPARAPRPGPPSDVDDLGELALRGRPGRASACRRRAGGCS